MSLPALVVRRAQGAATEVLLRDIVVRAVAGPPAPEPGGTDSPT